MKKVLVTGASGFIGKHVLAILDGRTDVTVHAVGRTFPVEAGTDVVWHTVDLLDAVSARRLVAEVRPTHLLHLAWEARPGIFWTSPNNLRWAASSLKLFSAFEDAGGKRFVGAGTCAEYDWTYSALREDETPYRPSTLYGVSKGAVRQCLEAASRLSDLSFAWGHVFFLYGPGEAPGRLVSDAIGNCLAGNRMETTSGHQLRDYMHVADVAGAFVALLDADVEGAVNIASGQSVPVRGVLARIEALTGNHCIDYGARTMSPNDPLCLAADVRRLREEVGFEPTYSLDAGLRQSVDWWRAVINSK